jgi:nucleotide-binding universal stress UspA family protein
MKILLAVDGSTYTERMLDYVGRHPSLFGPQQQYVAVTVVPPILAHAARFLDPSLIEGHHADAAQAVLAPVCERLAAAGLDVRQRHMAGHAAEAIAAIARDEGADLIVMGSHGHGALANVALGSVATGVLARSQVPVLIVR